MTDVLTVHAGQQPSKPATIEDRTGASPVILTYAEQEVEANRLAHALSGIGVGPGEALAWCGPNSIAVVRGSSRDATGPPLSSANSTGVFAHSA